MEKVVLVSVVVCALLAVAAAYSTACDGIWNIDKVEKCENHEKYPISMEVSKRKKDRHTDCFTIVIPLPEVLGSEYGLRMESYEKCDGGYKPSDVITGGACAMLNNFAKENFQEVLGQLGIEPKDCPIPKGKYEVKDYVINYESLLEMGKCGDFKWDIYLIKNAQKQSCVRAYTTFTAKENDEE